VKIVNPRPIYICFQCKTFKHSGLQFTKVWWFGRTQQPRFINYTPTS